MPYLPSLFLLLLVATGCGDSGNAAFSARSEAVAAHDSLLDALPEAAAQRLSTLDSLFLAYPDNLFLPVLPTEQEAQQWADSVYRTLSPRQRIGQLFIVALGRSTPLSQTLAGPVETHGVGGFLISRLMAPQEVFDAVTELQARSRVPVFVAADYERGVGRFNNPLTEIPSNMALGAARDTVLAAAAGRLTAIESRAIGVNFVFAPVADVNNNADNPIINIRSYGEQGGLVAEMAAAFIRQAERYGVLTTMKHFPGHGNTNVDTHSRLATIPGSRAALDSVELRPFQDVFASAHPPAAVMTAHLWAEGLDPDEQPATFSPRVLTDLLRGEFGYDGLVVTDDVRMGALQNTYALATRVTTPLRAGADIILTPHDLPAAINAVLRAVDDGTLPAARVEEAVKRVLSAKARSGLHRRAAPDRRAFDALMQAPLGAPAAQRMADRAVTVLKTDGAALPLAGRKTLLLHVSNYRDSESIGAAMDALDERLSTTPDMLTTYRYDRQPPTSAAAQLARDARQADVIVVALYLRLVSGRGSAGLSRGQPELVNTLLRSGKPVVLVTFGNPYASLRFPDADALVVLYDQTLASVGAAAGVLLGEQPAPGRLPITVGDYAFGSGLRQ